VGVAECPINYHMRYMLKKLTAQEADEIVRRIRANPWLFASEFPPMEDFRFAEEWIGGD
jgi:hypothetical protein